MAQLEWSDALALDLPLMDDTHREFVDLLAAVDRADDAQLLSTWHALVDHTDHHFAQEDAWMASTRFASGNCHSMQHRVVLQVMREGGVRAQQGALQLLRVGFDPVSGVVHAPHALQGELIQGCGGSTCSDTSAGVAATEPAAMA